MLNLIQYCLGISNVTKLLELLDSETEGSGFILGIVWKREACPVNAVWTDENVELFCKPM